MPRIDQTYFGFWISALTIHHQLIPAAISPLLPLYQDRSEDMDSDLTQFEESETDLEGHDSQWFISRVHRPFPLWPPSVS